MVNLAAYGNTSAASIPIALAEALEQGRVRPGGSPGASPPSAGGLTWAAAAYRWGSRVAPLGTSGAGPAAGPAQRPGVGGAQRGALREGGLTWDGWHW